MLYTCKGEPYMTQEIQFTTEDCFSKTELLKSMLSIGTIVPKTTREAVFFPSSCRQISSLDPSPQTEEHKAPACYIPKLH